MPARNVVLDLETLSTRPNAVVATLGAVLAEGDCTNTLQIAIQMQPQFDDGKRHVEADTVKWWMREEQRAGRNRMLDMQNMGAVTPYQACKVLDSWFGTLLTNPNDDVLIWGNGANFDNPILHGLGLDYGYQWVNWKWRNDRCYRTLRRLMPAWVLADDVLPKIAHDPVEDARAQAINLQRYLAVQDAFVKAFQELHGARS